MQKIREKKRAGIWWSRFPGLLPVALILLVLTGTGFAASNALDPNNSYFFAATSYNSAGLDSVYFNVVDNADSDPPAIAVTSPAEGVSFNDIIQLNVSAPETIAISKVQFFVNGLQSAESATVPYAFAWDTTTLSRGDYDISVRAIDAAGNQQASEKFTVSVAGDTVAPTVSLSAPANGATVSGSLVVSANAHDNVNVAKVEIYLDDILVASSAQSSTNYAWDTAPLSNGSHILSAKAYDAAGNVGLSANVAVNVFNDTVAPAVSIVVPALSGTASKSVMVSAIASDNVAVSRVEFFLNGALQATSSAAPYGFTWNTLAVANGAYSLTAKAYDAAGNVGQSAAVKVNVANDTSAPAIVFISPNSNYVYGNNVTISSSATDNTAVARMELYIDGSLKYTTGNGTFSMGWNFPLGPHTITVKAYDRANNASAASRSVYRFF